MAEEEFTIVELQEKFYRDGIKKIIIIITGVLLSIGLIVAALLYIYSNKPLPITFLVSQNWRVQADVPTNQPYLSVTDLLQWASDVIPKVFTYDFISYEDQQKQAEYYFTSN